MNFCMPLPKILPAAALIVASMAVLPAAHAFSDDEARRAILELRGQVQQMRDQSQRAQIQLSDRLDRMTQEIATLRGRIEELSRQPNAGGATPNAPQTPQQGDSDERKAYEAAADQYRNGQYKEAAGSFAAFVKSYPSSQSVGSALFYLGSSQYASKDFKQSIQTMQSLVKNHPDDPRAPDALLVVAADQIELNDMKGAKDSLQRIIKAYPSSSAAETAKSRLKLL